MRRAWAIAFVLAAGPLARAAEPLTLPEAVRFALENSPTYAGATKGEIISEKRYRNAWAAMFPTLDLSATHGVQDQAPVGRGRSGVERSLTAPGYSALSLGVRENLYDNGVSLTQVNISGLTRDRSELEKLRVRDDLIYSVSRAFYRFSLAHALREVRRQQSASLDRQFRSLSHQYQQGMKTKDDYLRLKSKLQRSEIDALATENEMASAQIELRRLLGASGSLNFVPLVAERRQTKDELVPARPLSLENTYEYRISRIQGEVNETAVTLARREYWPRLYATTGVAYQNSDYLNSSAPFEETDRWSWYALLGVEYNFWDWGIRRRNVEIATLDRDISSDSIRSGLLAVEAEMRNLEVELARFARSYELSREVLQLEEESNRNLESRYREGKATFLDLNSSLDSLLDAWILFYTSYFETIRGVARYRYFERNIFDSYIRH